ncbi:hypothetical protein ABMA28_015785 [Loxostege sticticalis]|uniref:Afadin n=1 Tax=Loxostege sticticalis TaxID=481309 RepID=A0ABD0TCW2_LOXSC
MDAADKRMLDREALRNMIQQWNANRLDLFELSEPNENLEFHGVMRFYFQDSGQKIATKCIRVASDATVSDVIETLIEKFRPDMRMLSLGSYSLWETHGPDDERRLEPHEKPLLVQLNWHTEDREGRFLLKCLSNNEVPLLGVNEKGDQNFKRKLSKREKKELKKKEKLSRLKSDTNDEKRPVAEKLYTELPETSFTRSISNPEAVMRRRRQQKLERKLQQFRSKDGGPDTGGTLKIYGSSLCPDVPYKTLLLSVGDSAATVVREMLDKYGLSRQDPQQYCIVQVDTADNSEYILDDDECPLAIVMSHPHHSSIMFHVRRRPADAQPRRRKKKPGGVGGGGRPGTEPALVEVAPDGATLENGRRLRITDVVEVGSGNGTALQLYGPSIQPRHCVVAPGDGGGYTVTPLHADAHVYLNGRRVTHTQRLQHGCLLKFGRVSTFRFVDPMQENILNRNLSQSQHFGSGSIYDRSPTSPGTNSAMSPTSIASHEQHPADSNANTTDEYSRTMSPVSQDTYYRDANDTTPRPYRDMDDNNSRPYRDDDMTPRPYDDNGQRQYREDDASRPYNNNTLKLDNESLMMSQQVIGAGEDYAPDEHTGSVYNDQEQNATPNRTANSQYKDNYETTFDLDGNVETKSICSAKSGGSGHDNRMSATVGGATRPGQEAILPAVLEFPEQGQAQFLAAVITRLDPHAPAFKLAPVYTLYLCARYRASTHYRPELTPTERAHKLTAFLHHVATLIHETVQQRCNDSAAQAFWMANASELLHFLKCDRHISSFSTQAQDLLPTTVQNAFSNLVTCFQEELSRALATLSSPNISDATEATAPTLQTLAAAMVLLRRCRVNAALTIQLFSHLFHYINAVCFNKLVTEPGNISARWGAALSARFALLAAWAERQGLEIAADCHLARTHQAARLIQGTYRTAEEVRAALSACFKLNSVQVRALLTPLAAPEIVEAAVAHARALSDELHRSDGREIRLEESVWLGTGLLIPGDGFSAEVVRGVPPGLAEFVAPLQRGGLCRLAHQPHAIGVWTVYMGGHAPTRPRPDPRVHIIQLNKNSAGMGLSIVAAKGYGQNKLGIYIKSVVAGGAAAADGRLAAGDQLLSVDGQSLVGITQEKAAEYLMRTGPVVTLEVAKQGAVLHGLATLLHQPAYNQKQEEVQYEDRLRRNSGTFTNTHPALLRPASPRTELATAGYGRRPCNDRCHLRDESSESSDDESEECLPHYHGSIPRLIITLDRETEQLQEDLSPDTPGCPLELKSAPPRPIPVFTFTCEDFDEQNPGSDTTTYDSHVPPDEPPPPPDPPAEYRPPTPPPVPTDRSYAYDQSSESGEPICLPPQMRPIDTKLTLDLFNSSRPKEHEYYRGRCTGVDECVSACDCCRTPQPETQPIPFIDEPNSEPLIFENDGAPPEIATPKIRRILPSLSLDQPDEIKKETADAICQTPSSPIEVKPMPTPAPRKLELSLDVKRESRQIDNIHCRLRRALFNMSKSFSSKSEDTEAPSTYSTSESCDETMNLVPVKSPAQTPLEAGAKQILDSADRKSWKSPDEYRPSFGKVKALTKHFNEINLSYCVKNYKRNCQSSPNLSGRVEKSFHIVDNIQSSASLANIHYESNKTDTTDTREDKMSDDEVKSILIQLEDWSRYGSRGSEDTLAQGNEFELPNLPSEEHAESGGFVLNEIIDKKPRVITLENIKLKSNQSSVNSEQVKASKESINRSESSENRLPRVVGATEKETSSLLDVSKVESRRESYSTVVQSCPNLSGSARGRSACEGTALHHSCPALRPAYIHTPRTGSVGSGGISGARRLSERDLPSRLAAEAVKPSKSTPALHHAHQPPPQLQPAHHAHAPYLQHSGTLNPSQSPGSPNAWANKSRSSHNLSAPHDGGFYQNLSTVHSSHHHTLQDRWSSLRSSTGSNRPQSAHFSAAAADQAPDSPLHQQQVPNTMSVRAAKLAEMSEEVTRRMQAQYQHKPLPAAPHPHQPSPQHHNHQQMGSQQQLLQQHQQQQQQLLQQQQQLLQQQQQGAGYPPQPQSPPPVHSPPPHHPQQMQQNKPPSRYDWHPPGPPSPQRSQPPVAPKPQNVRRSDNELDEQYQQMQQNQPGGTVQPDDERYVASALEPPAVSVYPAAPGNAGARQQPAHNPWQREERERQAEARRAANRARRDATIAQLLSLGAARTPVQNQQLRALQLERDFERRATQQDQEDAGAEGAVDDDRESPEPASRPQQPFSPPQHHQPQHSHPPPHAQPPQQHHQPPQHHSQGPAPPQSASPEPRAHPHPPKSILKTNRNDLSNGYASDAHSQPQHPQPPQPSAEDRRTAEISASISALHVTPPVSSGTGPHSPLSVGSGGPPAPPAPPARGSSFAVMAGRTRQHADPPPPQPQPQSSVSGGRDKRVSFHERPAAPASPAPAQPPAPPSTSPPPLDPPHAPHQHREDPDRFIEEAESMLAGPASPTSPAAPGAPLAAHTPGVIGAQEVYRDPRARRLAEQQARAATLPVPEQLSFKEKMKMFALESGENSTPKDKVKISRAQRDIDAVH